MPEDPKRYSPTPEETNRARQQGAGMGQRDLDTQRDADQAEGEQRSFDTADEIDADIVDPATVEELEADGSRQGIGRRADKAPTDREHGLKTRARNKQINSGRPFAG